MDATQLLVVVIASIAPTLTAVTGIVLAVKANRVAIEKAASADNKLKKIEHQTNDLLDKTKARLDELERIIATMRTRYE